MSKCEENFEAAAENDASSVSEEIRRGVGLNKETVIPPSLYGIIDTVLDFTQELNDLACEVYNIK